MLSTRAAFNCLFAAATAIVAPAASAHFLLMYTPELALKSAKQTQFSFVFTHPFEATHTMELDPLQEFYVVSQRGSEAKPQKTDLKQYVQPITWASLASSGKALEAKLPAQVTRSLGDYVFVAVPAPYYEKSEDKYIQQYTKVIMNVGGLPGNWDQPLGLPVEILPLDKPYANWTHGVFRGVVLSQGKPVANAELEVSYMNHAPDMAARKFGPAQVIAPQGSFMNMGIRTNDRGEFTIGLPRAGWWGICALGAGPGTEHQGKPLSQDAVLWVQATDMR
jgi:cobalt/nickel transport protein